MHVRVLILMLAVATAAALSGCPEEGPPTECTGVSADLVTAGVDAAAATDVTGSSDVAATPDAPPAPCPTCVGAPLPSTLMADFQPESCRHGSTYGLDLFKGRTTIVALLAAW